MDLVHGADASREGSDAQKRTHVFYFVKHHPYEITPNMACKIEQARLEIRKRRNEIETLTDTLRQIKSKRDPIARDLKYTSDPDLLQYIESKNEELASLKGRCTAKEREITDHIKELKHSIQNDNLSSVEERKLVKQMKKLEKQISDIRADASSKDEEDEEELDDSEIESIIQFTTDQISQMKMSRVRTREEVKQLRKELEVYDRGMRKAQQKINVAVVKRDKAHGVILRSEKLQDEANEYFNRSRDLINNAKELATKKDAAALAELSRREVEKFFSLWNADKSFRLHYERRAVSSLDNCGLSTDGRSTNPSEIP